jgi:hypothetical protein
MICLFFIFGSKSLSKIFIICTLSFIAYWNLLVVLLCSSNFASIPFTNLGVWNLRVWPLELVPYEPRFLCAVHISPIETIVELGFEGNIPSLLFGDGTNYCTYSGSMQNLVCVPLLTVEFETLTLLFISNAPTHLISTLAWERLVVLDQI